MDVDFPPSSFVAVVAFYTIFHLPREEHPELLRRVHRWLEPGGCLLATLTWRDHGSCTEDDLFSTKMYWSGYALEHYERLLAVLGFEVLAIHDSGHGFSNHHEAPPESHPLVLARRVG